MSSADRELFCLIADKNERAFNKIYYAYHPVLFSRIRRFIRDENPAEDITHEVFIKLWLYGSGLKEVQNPAAWLNRTASNMSINYIRREHIRRHVQEMTGYAAVTHTAADQDLGLRQLQLLVWEGMNQLPSPGRTILQFYMEDGYGPKLIAAKLELSENTVKKQLEVSRRFLRQYIKERLGSYLPLVLVAGILFCHFDRSLVIPSVSRRLLEMTGELKKL